MRDAGDRPLVPDLVRERAAQPGEQRDRNRAGGARYRIGNLGRDRLAQRRDRERPAARFGAGEELDPAQTVADRAEAQEIGLAREVEAVRLGRRRWRHQQGTQADPVARSQRRLRAAYAHPQLDRGQGGIEPLEGQPAERQSPAADPLLDQQDPSLEHVGAAIRQNRGGHQLGADRGRAQAERSRRQRAQRELPDRVVRPALRIARAQPGKRGRQ